MTRRPRAARLALPCLLLTGCASGAVTATRPLAAPSPLSTPRATSVVHPTARPVPHRTAPRPAAPPAFGYSASGPLTAADLPRSWHAGCPVPPSALVFLHLRFWGFDGTAHTGTLVVNQAVVPQVAQVFATLYRARFPIRRMVPVDAYGGSDARSTYADNTAGFNCRYAVTSGPPQWSMHAFGEAIDVDPVENPYLENGRVIPTDGAAYLHRGDVRPGMAEPGGVLVDAFAAVGWGWGGAWSGTPDYQHFSVNGR